MAGLAFRNPGGGMFHATGTQYVNPTHGTRRLCLRTGAGANDIVKYGFTSDMSASQYCRMSMRMPNGVVGRIGRYQTMTKSSSSSTNVQYQTTRATTVRTTTGTTKATKSTSINGTTVGGSRVIPFGTESYSTNAQFTTRYNTNKTITETQTNWHYNTTYTYTRVTQTTTSAYTTSQGYTTSAERYITNGTFNLSTFTTSTGSYIGTPKTYTYTDHPRDAAGNAYIGTVTLRGTSGTTYCTIQTNSSSYHTLQTALTSHTRPNNTYYIPSGGGGWGPPITDWHWMGYVTTNSVNRTVTYDTHVNSTSTTPISSHTNTTSMSQRIDSAKWTITINNFNL